MVRTFASSAALALVAFAVSGCATTASNDLRTSGIYANYWVEQVDDGDYTVRASYRASEAQGNIVELSDGEAVYVNNTLLANKTSALGLDVNYSTTLAKGAATYTFELRRNDGEIVRHDLTPPETLTITSSALAGTYSGSYTITWTPGTKGAKVDIKAESNDSGCNVSRTVATGVADSGSHTFSAAELAPTAQMGQAMASCRFNVVLEREVTIAIGAPFKNGVGRSIAKRATSLALTP